MAIEREENQIVFLCDDARCNEILRTETEDFMEAVEFAKENNWKIRKMQGGGWSHFCPDEDLDGLDL